MVISRLAAVLDIRLIHVMDKLSYCSHRFPAIVIQNAVWLTGTFDPPPDSDILVPLQLGAGVGTTLAAIWRRRQVGRRSRAGRQRDGSPANDRVDRHRHRRMMVYLSRCLSGGQLAVGR